MEPTGLRLTDTQLERHIDSYMKRPKDKNLKEKTEDILKKSLIGSHS